LRRKNDDQFATVSLSLGGIILDLFHRKYHLSQQTLQVIELFAGTKADGEAVVEQLRVRESEDDTVQLVTSPVFVPGIARGDVIRKQPGSNQFELVKRAGNLCIRVYSRVGTQALADQLVPELEKLGGELDVETERVLVFSIHVSCGFSAIEEILERAVANNVNAQWLYGNVYDPTDGETPLNWWQAILQPE
jgi:hypothetical protein